MTFDIDPSDTTAVIERLNELENDVFMDVKERDEAIELLGLITWLRRSLLS
jgi:hypothetical protein